MLFLTDDATACSLRRGQRGRGALGAAHPEHVRRRDPPGEPRAPGRPPAGIHQTIPTQRQRERSAKIKSKIKKTDFEN